MSKAIFHKSFNFAPKGEGFSLNVKASTEPQTFPKRVIEAAIDAGAASAAPSKKPKNQE